MFRFTFYGSHAHFQQKFCTICGAAFEPACVCVCVCMPSKIYGNQMHIGECIANGNVLNRCIKWTVFALHGPEIVQSYLKIEIQTGGTNEREKEMRRMRKNESRFRWCSWANKICIRKLQWLNYKIYMQMVERSNTCVLWMGANRKIENQIWWLSKCRLKVRLRISSLFSPFPLHSVIYYRIMLVFLRKCGGMRVTDRLRVVAGSRGYLVRSTTSLLHYVVFYAFETVWHK